MTYFFIGFQSVDVMLMYVNVMLMYVNVMLMYVNVMLEYVIGHYITLKYPLLLLHEVVLYLVIKPIS